ncbi:protein MIZU-KUSSEI 1-like [Bidens hawaiensis]|uniref:protein MIZU-KUSSEI 1-like n=1 Tax=Bidens hawaiensis TaxID=980011 RepID=UPI0040496DAE
MNHDSLVSMSRNNSGKLIPSNYIITTSFMINPNSADENPLVGKDSPVSYRRFSGACSGFSKLIRSLLTVISIPAILPTFRRISLPYQLSLTPSLGRKVTGTLFGNRRGQVSFAVQYDPRSAPVLIIEMAVSTASLVKEMSSGLVRIALECEKRLVTRGRKLLKEPVWTMYCNGKKCGYASSKACTDSDWHVFSTVQSVSVGAGVIPVLEDGRMSNASGSGAGGSVGELVYMRAKFERVVGSRDSEAYYMMNPDQSGGPELSIFLLRI